MIQNLRKTFFALASVLIAGLFTSCGSTLGWSVLLWNNTEHQIVDGTVVRVYIKSNISHVYVVAVPNSKEKIELPVWQITEPVGHHKAKKYALRYAEYAQTYATVSFDGLPIREEPVNTSKQVYRLKKDEKVRVLYKGKGQSVTNGKGALKGEWLRVLTSSGTQGWCFSYNLRLYKASLDGENQSSQNDNEEESVDTQLESVLANKWYPDYYADMISSGRIDPSRMNTSYCFDCGSESGTVRISLPGVSVSYPYSGTTKTKDNVYEFNGTSVKLTVRNENAIVVQYSDNDGRLSSAGFITISENVEELVSAEQQRRSNEFEQLLVYGPQFRSSNYGRLVLKDGGSFTWSDYKLLVPSVIKKEARGAGSVSIKYFISDALKVSYDGVLTFKFSGMENEVNFLYKIADGGLRLEDATDAEIKNNIVTSRGPSPVVVFFNRGSGN